MDDLSTFCCQNPDCPDYGQRGQGNLTVCMRYGRHQRRLLYCKSCKARFSERKGTPLFDTRLPPDKAVTLLEHLADGCGVRQTARLVGVSVVAPRCDELVELLVEDFYRRTGGRDMELLTADEYAAYAEAIRKVYGEEVLPQRTGKPGRPRLAYRRLPEELVYATVHKVREDKRVVAVHERLICGSQEQLQEALANSAVSRFTLDSGNNCRPVRTLRQKLRRKEGRRKWRQRKPATAAGLTDHVWSIAEWVSRPSVQRK